MVKHWQKIKSLAEDYWRRLRASASRPKGIAALPASGGGWSFSSLSTHGLEKISQFRWDSIVKHSFLYNSVALAIAAYFLADLAMQVAIPNFPSPAPPRPRPTSSIEPKTFDLYHQIMARNLFSEKNLIPNNDVGLGIDGAPVKTSLPMTLLGVIVLSDEGKSVASVDDKGTNLVWAVRAGDMIGNDVEVEKIEETRMIFLNKRDRRREFVELPQDLILAKRAAPSRPSAGIQHFGEDRVLIDRKEVDKVMENFNEVLTQARCVPNFEGGRAAGYRCFQIEPGSIYDKLGMKDNDVICGINGEPVNDPAKAFSLLQQLKTARNIELCINRDGKISNKTYEIN
jgi:general secretion pathway protein C